jgi:hypothetical protein
MSYTKQDAIKNGEVLKAEYLHKMEEGIVGSFSKQRLLTSSDDLDNIKTVGEYAWCNELGGVPANAPTTESTMSLSVFVSDVSGSPYPELVGQFAKSTKYGMFYRNTSRNTGKFTSWKQLSFGSDSPSASGGVGNPSYEERVGGLHCEQWTQRHTVVGSTYPTYGGNSTGYIKPGTVYNGIIYSSTFREGSDVLWNFNPSTYYSAVANPASLLYTVDYRGKVFNESSWAGSVCSTTAMKACGYNYPYSSSGVKNIFREKVNTDIDNVEVGDILWVTGHVAGVVGVTVGSDYHVTSVKIVEQAGSVRVFEVTAANWDTYFAGHWTAIYRGDEYFDKDWEAPIDFPNNFTIIFERGNNTYVEDYSKMLFYIPTATTVYLTKDGTTTEYATNSFPTETVNGITVYDLASLFTGVGDYYFHTNEDTTDMIIKVINHGIISIDTETNTVTLSGYENCKPHGCMLVKILDKNTSTSYNFWNAPEGYTSSGMGSTTYRRLTEDVFSVKDSVPVDVAGWKMEVWYNTGYGWARFLSDNIMLTT